MYNRESLNESLSPVEFLNSAFKELNTCITKSKHCYRIFSFATVKNNFPEIRSVVLRQFNPNRRSIIFHSDIRSPKIAEVKENSNVGLLFYCHQLKLQLRFRAFAHIHYKDSVTKSIFKTMRPDSKACYSYDFDPGKELALQTKEIQLEDTKGSLVNPEENFSVVICNYSFLDLLYLTYKGHIRIHYNWDKYGELKYNYVVA